jgi:hypothetical protein
VPADKPAPRIPDAIHRTLLDQYDGSYNNGSSWHYRWGTAGNLPRTDLRRIYFNAMPDHAADLANGITGELNRRGIPFEFKVRVTPEGVLKRADAAVLYVDGKYILEAEQIAREYIAAHPEAVADGYPSFTKPLARGVAGADEPVHGLQGGPIPGRKSFGGSRADIIAEAILNQPFWATRSQIKEAVRANFLRYGIDPDQPWLRQAP